MRSVVVGGLGFLGAAVVDALLSDGEAVEVVDPVGSQKEIDARFGAGRVRARKGDVLDPASLRRAFDGAAAIYHFAGKLGTSELDEDITTAIAVNVTGAVNVFQAAVVADVPRVFYPSKPNVWLNTYTITKAASEDFARLYAANHPIRMRSLRYFNAYGPGQAIGPIRKIIPTFALQALRGEPLTIFGDGTQTVDMIYSADIGRITVDFLNAAQVDDIVLDCGRGVAITVNEVADAVNAVVGNRAGAEHVPMRRGEAEQTTLVASIEPLERAIGPLHFADWETSLRETIEWYARRWPNGRDDSLRDSA